MTEQELQAVFKKLQDGVELTNAEMIELARNSGYVSGQMKRLELGVSDFQKGLKKAVDELPTALLKSAGQTAAASVRLVGNLDDATQGFKQLNPVIDAAASALGKIPIIGVAFTAAAEASKFMISQLQNATDAFQEVAKVGGLTASGMSGLQQQFLQSGMTLKAYTKTISANSSALANFAGSVGEGAEKFSRTAGTVQKEFGTGLMRLGYSFEEIGETTADYIARQTRLGLSQGKSNEVLAAGAAKYALELDELSKLTGASKTELKKQQEEALSEARFRATIDEMLASGDEKKIKQANNLINAQSLLSKENKSLGRAFRDSISGYVGSSQEAIQGFMATGGRMNEIAEKAKDLDPTSILEMTRGAAKDNLAIVRDQAKFGNEYAGNYAELSNFTQGIVRNAEGVKKTQKDQMEGGDQLTNSTVDAQRSMQEMSRQINLLGFTLMPHAAKAVEGFTGALETVVKAINKTLGVKDAGLGGGGTAPKGGNAKQRLADARQQKMEQALAKAEEDAETLLAGGTVPAAGATAPKTPGAPGAAPTADLNSGPVFGRGSDKIQLTLEEIRDELKKLVRIGGVPGMPGGMPQASVGGGTGGGAASGGGGAPSAGGPVSGDFGAIAEKYESGGRGSGTVGWDVAGGTSYGKKQISSKVGAMTDYLKYLEKVGKGDIAKKLRDAGIEKDTGGTTGRAVDVWKEVAASGALGNTETEFLKSQSYDVAMAGLKDQDLQTRISNSRALQEMLFSTSVQHGGAGAMRILNSVFKKGMSDEELIKAVYAERGAEGGKKHFGSSTAAVQASVVSRFGREQADVMALLKNPPSTTAAAPTTPVAPTTTASATPVSPMLTTPTAPTMTPAMAPAAGLAGQGQNVIASGLQAITTQLFGAGGGAPGMGGGNVGADIANLLTTLISVNRDQNSNLSKILSASTA